MADIHGWGVSPRGAGYLFGSDVVAQVKTIFFSCVFYKFMIFMWYVHVLLFTMGIESQNC